MVLKDADGRRIVEYDKLAGSKFAVRRAGKLYVSPAMMKLLRDCQDDEELHRLIGMIPCRVLSASRPLPGIE
jgi:hypothetical protein